MQGMAEQEALSRVESCVAGSAERWKKLGYMHIRNLHTHAHMHEQMVPKSTYTCTHIPKMHWYTYTETRFASSVRWGRCTQNTHDQRRYLLRQS